MARRLGCKQAFVSKVENGIAFPNKVDLPKWLVEYRCQSKDEFRLRWSLMTRGLPLWRMMNAAPDTRLQDLAQKLLHLPDLDSRVLEAVRVAMNA
jgi:hypothetical protein